ncbi:hypothetical protein BH11BAC2_BH11BAC2_11290 [soil metagenome]
MIELVRRDDQIHLSAFERFSIGMMLVFFVSMMFMFFIFPKL